MLKKKAIPFSLPIAFTIILSSSIAWVALYQWLDTPSEQESLHLFLSSNTYASTLENDLKEGLEGQNLKQVTITALAPTNTFYASTLATVGIQECDLLVLPKTVLDGLGDFSDFAPLEESTLLALGLASSDYSFFSSGETPVGIKVYDGASENNLFNGWATFEGQDDCFIMINVNTVNSGLFSIKGGNVTDNAFDALAYLLANSPTQP